MYIIGSGFKIIGRKGDEMQFRHEVKHEISNGDMIVLRQRLRAVMKPDKHCTDGIYRIRSLYFDNVYDKALREKLDGIKVREKYRIRIYNNDLSLIRLERKYKNGNIGFKETALLSEDEVRAIICGDISHLSSSKDPVILSFYSKLKNEGLKPKVIVDYTREPFVFEAGNVRVTLDSNIRTGLSSVDILDPNVPTVPIANSPIILEVKWDNFLPDIIRDALALGTRKSGAFSKYAACRMYD